MKGFKLMGVVFLPIAFGACASAISQEEIPSVVINAVMTKYPDATDLDWEVKGGVYEAEFDLGKEDYEVWVNSRGTILKVAQEIKNTQVPGIILKKIRTDFKDFKLDDAKRIEIAQKVYFELELDGTFGDQRVVYSVTGEKQDPVVLTEISK